MARPCRFIAFALVFVPLATGAGLARSAAPDVPSRLSDQEFWQLTESLSEPNGNYPSDNLLSNEMAFKAIVPALVAQTRPGGVYLGVGPEQNFTYIAAMKPRMAFITDIRRGNLHLHLMYKALFELSADRAEFVSRLFTKPRPDGLSASSTVTELMNAYWEVFTANQTTYDANLAAIQNHLTKTHTLPLTQEDLDGIARVYRAFYWYGPSMGYLASVNLALPSASNAGFSLVLPSGETRLITASIGPDYRSLMTQIDDRGQGLSYLASEEKFAFLRDLERRNLVVPVVGDFAGPKALRAVGAYVKTRGATVTAFYTSNVESVLSRAGKWSAFCANVATMPIDENSLFVRGLGSISLAPMANEVAGCK